jgi:hypothetical protein
MTAMNNTEAFREHGRDIWFEGKENGSSFVFTLPRGVPKGVEEAGPSMLAPSEEVRSKPF